MSEKTTLKRSLNLIQLVLYGLGTTIGAGIYALVGELAGISGYQAPLAFLIASLMAAMTALSFAELSGRFPRCAGAALYVKEGFSSERLSAVVGLMVIAAGLVSAAALINGFVGYLNEFVQLDRVPVIIVVVLAIGAIAAWGISESITIASLVTVIEISGLLIIIGVGYSGFTLLPERLPDMLPSMEASTWGLAFSGALLAFYAFIGFEDMVETAEEVRDARRRLPLGIMLTLGITTVLYMLVMLTAILAMKPETLAGSEAPLALVYEHYTGDRATVISVIGLLAIINGALIQVIMASRVMYGMSTRGLLPALIGYVYPRTRTPIVATLVSAGLVLSLALIGRLASLAEATSVIMLCVFTMVNLALLRIKHSDSAPDGLIVFPRAVPLFGFLVSAGFVLTKGLELIRG